MKNSVVMAAALLLWAGPRLDFQGTGAGHGWAKSVMAETATVAPPAESSQATFQPSVQVEGDHLAVIVEGQGDSRAAAMDQAWLEAVRLAVGMMIEARTEIDQNQVAERIIAHSRGVVDGYEILMTDNQAGVYRLRMKAKVRRDVLRDGLQYVASKGQVIAFSVEDLEPRRDLDLEALEAQDAKANTEATRARDGATLLVETLRKFKPEDFLILQSVSKLRAVPDKPDTFEMDFEVSFNEDRYYKEYAPELKRVLDQIAVEKKKEFYRDPKAIEGIRALKKEGVKQSLLNESIYNQYAQQVKGPMLFDTSNPFAYIYYVLEPSLLDEIDKQISPPDGSGDKSDAYKFTIGLYDQSSNEVFSADGTIALHVNSIHDNPKELSDHQKVITLASDLSNMRSPKKVIANQMVSTLDGDPSKKSETKMWKDFVAGTAFIYKNKHVMGVSPYGGSWLEIGLNGKSYWLREMSKGSLNIKDEITPIVVSYLPSINMNKPSGVMEALKHRFTVTLTVPQELFEQVKTIRITPLK